MAEDDAGKKPSQQRRRAPSRKTSATKGTTPTPASTEPSASTPGSSASSSPLDLEHDRFEPPDRPTPADDEIGGDEYTPLPAEPLEWTPERAGTIVKAGGYMLHTADSLTGEPGGDELWRATEADVDAIAPPLARILNRYEPARRLAGLSDEGELLIGMAGYFRKNLATRGRVLTAKREAEAAAEEPGWGPQAMPPPEPQ